MLHKSNSMNYRVKIEIISKELLILLGNYYITWGPFIIYKICPKAGYMRHLLKIEHTINPAR